MYLKASMWDQFWFFLRPHIWSCRLEQEQLKLYTPAFCIILSKSAGFEINWALFGARGKSHRWRSLLLISRRSQSSTGGFQCLEQHHIASRGRSLGGVDNVISISPISDVPLVSDGRTFLFNVVTAFPPRCYRPTSLLHFGNKDEVLTQIAR